MKKANKEKILIAEITKPQGIKGEVRVRVFCQPVENFLSYKILYSEKEKAYQPKQLRHIKENLFAIKFANINSRTQAEGLAGTQLFVPRSELPPANENEFYVTDLIGLAVYERHEKHLGKIVNVANFGAGDLLEILPHNQKETFYLVFNETNVPVVDIAAKKVVICRPKEV